MLAEPFSLTSEGNFSPADPRTRITVFCTNLDFLSGEPASALTVDAQDAAGTDLPLKVEYVGTVPNFDGVYMVVVRLNDLMSANLGDVLVRLNLHGMAATGRGWRSDKSVADLRTIRRQIRHQRLRREQRRR